MNFVLLILALNYLLACSLPNTNKSGINRKVDVYNLKDNSGQYLLKREIGLTKNNEVVAKVIVSDSKGNLSRPSERIVSISSYGQLKTNKKNVRALRPKTSAYQLWLEGKKHSNKIRINLESKSLDVSLNSPIMEWNGKRNFKFPKDNPLFCFYSQLVECASVTSFLKNAVEKKQGKMNFYLIWNGYPFFSEMYANIPRKLFSKAELIYESEISSEEHRFSLNVENQKMFYHIGQGKNLEKFFWVSQGLSLIKKTKAGKKEKKKI